MTDKPITDKELEQWGKYCGGNVCNALDAAKAVRLIAEVGRLRGEMQDALENISVRHLDYSSSVQYARDTLEKALAKGDK